MNLFATMLTTLALFTPVPLEAQALVISRGGSRGVRTPPPANFTGQARVEMLFEAVDPSHASGGYVTFEPRARTAWHSHPRGQILIVTAGVGRVQLWGGPLEEVRAGDVARIPAGQKHWHGASPQTPMTHIAIGEHRDGTVVEWMEHVSDAQYNAAVSPQEGATRPSGPRQQALAPGLAALTDDVLFGDMWRRPELSPRDRSLVTISVLIATGKSAQLTGHLGRALDNGLQPTEASGVLAHLAIYSGWPNAVSALDAYEQVYTARNVDTKALTGAAARTGASGPHTRHEAVTDAVAAIAPKFAQLTNDVVFDDLLINRSRTWHEGRRLGPFEVSSIGLGVQWHPGRTPDVVSDLCDSSTDRRGAIALIKRAVDRGVTLFDTAEAYGPFMSVAFWQNAIGSKGQSRTPRQ